MWKHLPNLISGFRICLIPVYLYFFYLPEGSGRWIAGWIVLLAGLSDWLDGTIARRYELTSKVGAALDPLADKLMSLTVFLTLAHVKLLPIWFFIGMLAKEAVMLLGGTVLYFRGSHQSIPSNVYGKVATILFYIAILLLLFRVPRIALTVAFGLTFALNWLALFVYVRRAWSQRNEIE